MQDQTSLKVSFSLIQSLEKSVTRIKGLLHDWSRVVSVVGTSGRAGESCFLFFPHEPNFWLWEPFFFFLAREERGVELIHAGLIDPTGKKLEIVYYNHPFSLLGTQTYSPLSFDMVSSLYQPHLVQAPNQKMKRHLDRSHSLVLDGLKLVCSLIMREVRLDGTSWSI